MKSFYLSCLFICFSYSSRGQLVYKFLDSETKKPIERTYIKVLENGKKSFRLNSTSNTEGFFKLRVKYLASRVKYEIYIDDLKYNLTRFELDLKRKDTAIVMVDRNPYFIAAADDVYSVKCDSHLLDYVKIDSPRDLNNLPDLIQRKVVAYLISLVGKEQVNNFQIVDGDIIDFTISGKDFYIDKDEPTYYLCFAYRNLDAGIAMYSSNVFVGADGKIIKGLEFPDLGEDNNKSGFLNLFPYQKLKKLAKERGILIETGYVDNKKTSYSQSKIEMGFDRDSNVLLWKVINKRFYQGNKCEHFIHIFNAHTGAFIKTDKWLNCTYIND